MGGIKGYLTGTFATGLFVWAIVVPFMYLFLPETLRFNPSLIHKLFPKCSIYSVLVVIGVIVFYFVFLRRRLQRRAAAKALGGSKPSGANPRYLLKLTELLIPMSLSQQSGKVVTQMGSSSIGRREAFN